MAEKVLLGLAGKAALDAVSVHIGTIHTPADLVRHFEIALRAITNYVVATKSTASTETMAIPRPQKVFTPVNDHIKTGKECPHGSFAERKAAAMAYKSGKTLAAAAEAVRRSRNFVRKACVEFGVPIRSKNAPRAKKSPSVPLSVGQEKAALSLYKRDYGCGLIAKKLGCGKQVVERFIREKGIMRNKQEAALARARYDARCNGLMQ